MLIAEHSRLIAFVLRRYSDGCWPSVGGSFLSCESAEEWLSVHNPDLAILDIMLQSFAGTAANANRPAPGNRRPLFRFGPIGRHVVSARVNGSSGSSTLDQAILASPLGAISTLPPDMSRLAPAKLAAASKSSQSGRKPSRGQGPRTYPRIGLCPSAIKRGHSRNTPLFQFTRPAWPFAAPAHSRGYRCCFPPLAQPPLRSP